MFGLPGVGKSHVAAAIGHALVDNGHSVLFAPAYRVVQDLLAAKRDLALPRALRRLDVFDLLASRLGDALASAFRGLLTPTTSGTAAGTTEGRQAALTPGYSGPTNRLNRPDRIQAVQSRCSRKRRAESRSGSSATTSAAGLGTRTASSMIRAQARVTATVEVATSWRPSGSVSRAMLPHTNSL